MAVTLYDPKDDIYTILRALSPGVYVSQDRPEVIAVFPSITFYINNNVPTYDLGKNIPHQDIEVVIDIWCNTSIESGQLLSALTDTMLNNNYMLTFSQDIPETSTMKISHISTLFKIKQ